MFTVIMDVMVCTGIMASPYIPREAENADEYNYVPGTNITFLCGKVLWFVLYVNECKCNSHSIFHQTIDTFV